MSVLKNQKEGFLEVYQKFQQQVLLFNTLAGNDINDKSLIALYEALVIEEAEELFEAETIYDIIDHMIDVLVVGEYLAHLYGYEDGILTGNGLKGEANCHGIVEDVSHLIYLLKQPERAVSLVLDKLQHCAMNFADAYFPHEKLMNEIMESNLSKFIPSNTMSVEEAQEVCRTIESNTKYKGIDFKMINGYYVFTDSNGKVMKAHDRFKDVDLTKYY
jgi:hypothetical protein